MIQIIEDREGNSGCIYLRMRQMLNVNKTIEDKNDGN